MIRETLVGIAKNKKWCFFAINNVCNNRCEMCSIWKEKPKIVGLEDAKLVIDRLHENNFKMLQLTGGEPLLNKDFFEIVKYAKEKNFLVFAPTNGTVIDARMADRLKESEIDQVSISFHHYDPKIFARISGNKEILKKVLRAIRLLKRRKVAVSALCTITNDNKNDLEEIVRFLDKMDVTTSFCLPIKVSGTTFKLGSDNGSANIEKEEMRSILFRIIEMKKKGYNIVNSFEFLMDMVRYLDNKNEFHCQGGKKLLYIDWNLNVFPCMCRGKPVNIKDYNFKEERKNCNKCMIQCFREPSILLYKRRVKAKLFLKELPFSSRLIYKRIKTLIK